MRAGPAIRCGKRPEVPLSTRADGPILLCFDRSDGARRAIEAAGALFPGRKAIVLHVWRPLTVVAAEYGGLMSLPDDEGSALEKLANELAAEGARLAALRASMRRPRSPRAPTRAPGTQIVETAHARGAAVIVIGARGLSTFKSFVLGSVSHGVAQHARVPVVIVPPAERLRRPSDPRQAGATARFGGVQSATAMPGPGMVSPLIRSTIRPCSTRAG